MLLSAYRFLLLHYKMDGKSKFDKEHSIMFEVLMGSLRKKTINDQHPHCQRTTGRIEGGRRRDAAPLHRPTLGVASGGTKSYLSGTVEKTSMDYWLKIFEAEFFALIFIGEMLLLFLATTA